MSITITETRSILSNKLDSSYKEDLYFLLAVPWTSIAWN